jgi:hypothetical protein
MKKTYPFRFIARQGWAGLVEVNRDGNVERCLLPMGIITDGKELTAAQLNAGIPYGLPFADILNAEAETALHNAGVWTLADLHNKANQAVGALASVGLKLSAAIQAVIEYEKQDHKSVTQAATPAPKSKKGD